MKKRMLILVTLAVALIINVLPVSATSTKDIEGILENQNLSLEAYEEMKSNLSEGIKKSKDIGSVYIDDEGFINIGIVKGHKKPDKVKNEFYIKYYEVQNSYEILYDTQKSIYDQFEPLKLQGIEVYALYVDNVLNKVVLETYDEKAAKHNEFIKSFGNEILEIVETDEKMVTEDVSLQNGTGIVVNGYAGTVGYGATKVVYRGGRFLTVSGIVTTGHFPNMSVGNQAYYGGNNCGFVESWKNSGNTDAAFIELYSGYQPTSSTINGTNIKGTSSSVQGLNIKLYGLISGVKLGQVVAVGVLSGSWNNTDTVRATYSCQNGDSGGTVCYYESVVGGDLLLGVHESHDSTYGYYVQVNNVNSTLGIGSVITN